MRSKVTCGEHYLGSHDDVAHILEYLRVRRLQALTPEFMTSHLQTVTRAEISSATRFRTLSEFLADRDDRCFDYTFFDQAVKMASVCLRERFPKFSHLSRHSYVIADSKPENGSLGGFYGRFGIGFQYELNFGFSELLDPRCVSDGTLRAYELARNYTHDSFHAATYRSFGWHEGIAFRYQYGINFRLPNGISYSSALSDPAMPFTVNLNALMDGVTVLVTAHAMRAALAPMHSRDKLARDILSEVRGDYRNIDNDAMLSFADTVVQPAERFLAYWGGEHLLDLVGQTMLDGNLAPLRGYMEGACAEQGGDFQLAEHMRVRREAQDFLGRSVWEDLFLSSDFRNELGRMSDLKPLTMHCGLSLQ